MGFDHYVADIDTHTEEDAPVFRIAECKLTNAGLKVHASAHRFDRARKLCQEPVSSVLHDAAAMCRNRGRDTVR